MPASALSAAIFFPGMLNPSRLKGIHTAIKSGMLAAETLFEAHKKNDFSPSSLAEYQKRYDASWIHAELYKSRNFHAGFEGGLLSGLINSSLQILTGGRGFFNRRPHKADHEMMLRRDEYLAKYGREPGVKTVKLDNRYTFDKVTDVYKSGTKHEEHQPSHLVIADYDICNRRCTEEYGNPCQYFCPADVYNMVDDESGSGKKKLQLTPSNCVHCKTCDIKDPSQNIHWVVPEGGGGPSYPNM
ncbi:MAG: 4Fe-4S dicluster domain-containing protein [Proteobacteria bacterium]|nr:4Fe-4S dicluster domain-containing protein [Pseudomonadota bacterium]